MKIKEASKIAIYPSTCDKGCCKRVSIDLLDSKGRVFASATMTPRDAAGLVKKIVGVASAQFDIGPTMGSC